MPTRRATILLADDDEDLRVLVRTTLEPEFEVVGEASDGVEVQALAAVLKPDIIIMDIQMPRLDGMTACRDLLAKTPELAVIMLSARGKFEDLREALAAGARDYVVKPFETEELRRTVREVAGQQRSAPPPPPPANLPGAGIWAFTRATGGTGQTSLLLSMAFELVNLKRKVVVIDLHPHFGHIAFYLGLDQRKSSVADLAELPASASSLDILGDLTVEHPSGIRVMTAPREFVQGHTLDFEALCIRIREVATAVDYVLIDLPPGIPDQVLPILDAARFVFLVANGSYSSLLSMRELLRLLVQLDYPLEKLRPLMTGYRSDEKTRRDFDEVLAKLGSKIAHRFPFDPETTARAALAGQPVSKVFPRAELSRAVRSFLAPLLEISEAEMPGYSEGSGSILSRVFGSLVS